MLHLSFPHSFYSIHERSAREKISSDQVAHVLNDEVSRKYIQSLKRYGVPFVAFCCLLTPKQVVDFFSNQIPPGGQFSADGLILSNSV